MQLRQISATWDCRLFTKKPNEYEENSFAHNSRNNRRSVFWKSRKVLIFLWTIETTLINLKKINYMHLLLAALLEGQQTHRETVNERGVAGEVELKVMYRSLYVQKFYRHDMMYLTSVCIFWLVLRTVMSGVGREKERGFYKYKMLSM